MMKTQAAVFTKLCKEIEIEFIIDKIDFEEKARVWQRKINSKEL